MRISDWSSDVCSSDLRSLHRHARCPGPRLSRVGGVFPQFSSSPACAQTRRLDSVALLVIHIKEKAMNYLLPPYLVDHLPQDERHFARAPDAFFPARSEEHTSALQSLLRISSAVCCWQTKKAPHHHTH